jgi:hypothetical protein
MEQGDRMPIKLELIPGTNADSLTKKGTIR